MMFKLTSQKKRYKHVIVYQAVIKIRAIYGETIRTIANTLISVANIFIKYQATC